MKQQGKTYKDVAQILNLSEASVKRLFAEHNLSLERLDLLCDWLDLEYADLVTLMARSQRRTSASPCNRSRSWRRTVNCYCWPTF
ncbi:helix-turn-helix domain-containing protein [Aliamphritea spongicola]|nr:helix-turn-helix domain-containing protein [Aliamphritea spongicola]